MPVLEMKDKGGYLHFDHEQCVAAGRARAEQYRTAKPFPHIVMDDFLDVDILRALAAEFPSRDGRTYFDRAQERFKYQFNPNTVESGRVRNLLAELNAEPMLTFLSEMTGIKGLVSDPYYEGGGLHETLAGGHLSVHADFNIHGGMQMERRLNLLIYLNDEWLPEYGGALELWDKNMRAAAHSVLPTIGRAVIFSTDRNSFHGQPNPLTCPPDRSRRSIATYYYTALPIETSLEGRNTDFKRRPGSGDRWDWRAGYERFVLNWIPPRLQRAAMRLAAQRS